MAEEGIKVEAEGGELVLRNNFGDYAIIPKDSRDKIKELIAEECWSCIDDFVKDLPTYNDYAEEGSFIPASGVGRGEGDVAEVASNKVDKEEGNVAEGSSLNYELYPITGIREEEVKVLDANTDVILENLRNREGFEIYKFGELSPDSSELVKNFFSLYDSESYESDPVFQTDEYYSAGTRVLQGISDERVINSYLQRVNSGKDDLSIDHSGLEVARDSGGNLLGYDVFYRDEQGNPHKLNLWRYGALEEPQKPYNVSGGQSTSRIKISSKVVDSVPDNFTGTNWEDARGRTHIATFTDELTGEDIPYEGLEEYGAKFTTYGSGFRRKIEPIGEGVPYRGRMIKLAGEDEFQEMEEVEGEKSEGLLETLKRGGKSS